MLESRESETVLDDARYDENRNEGVARGATTGISDPLQMFSGRFDEHEK